LKKDKIEVLTVGGYGYSGGTAVLDLIREIDGCCELGIEFRLIKDPYGIMDLEEQLVTNWRNPLNADIAIKDFIWLVNNLARKPRKFSKTGLNYQNKISSKFLKYSHEYIKDLTQFTYQGNWHILKFRENWANQIFNRIKRKLYFTDLKAIYYAKPSKEEFISSTKKYLVKILTEPCKLANTNRIVLHNAIDSYHPEKGLEYFDSIKMIIVDRDPRDIYVDVINQKASWFLGDKLIEERDVLKFIKDYRIRRERQNEVIKDKRIFCLRFEELVFDYENKLNDILSFLELDKEQHLKKGACFVPQISQKNIGLWKCYDQQQEIDLIFNNLKEYCFKWKR